MTSVETIHEAEARIAFLQDKLDNAQRVLSKVEKAVSAGESVKQHSRLILIVTAAIAGAIGGLIIVRYLKKRRDRRDQSQD